MNDSDLIKFHKVDQENLLDKKNVESFFPGIKVSKGNSTGEKCIIVGVSKKESLINIKDEDLVPSSINGIKTDVIEVPKMYAFGYCGAGQGSLSPSEYHSKGCPGNTYNSEGKPFECVPGGASIGPSSKSSAGTLGFSVKDSNNNIVGITNNHVAGTEAYDPSSQPSITYSVGYTTDNGLPVYTFLNTSTSTTYVKPSFNDVDAPRIESGRSYIFEGTASLDTYPFFLTTYGNSGGTSAQTLAYTQVTIKNSSGTVIYKDGSEINSSGRVYPFLKNGETMEFKHSDGELINNKKIYYQAWNEESMGNEFQIMFFGVPYCLSSNNSTNYTEDYNDGLLNEANKDITNVNIVTPSNIDKDGNGGSGQNTLGSISKTKSLKFTHQSNLTSKGNHGDNASNKIDAAIINFTNSSIPTPELAGLLNSPFETTEAVTQKKVFKSGRTTGVTPEGGTSASNAPTILSTTWTGLVHYCSSHYTDSSGNKVLIASSQHVAKFTDCIYYYSEGYWFSDSGDSGSAILMEDSSSYKVVGLHFAGYTNSFPAADSSSSSNIQSHGLACKISNVLSEFSLSSWNGQRSTLLSNLNGKDAAKICDECYEKSASSLDQVGELIDKSDLTAFYSGLDCVKNIYPSPSQSTTFTPITPTETHTMSETLTHTMSETLTHTMSETLTQSATSTQSATETLTQSATSTQSASETLTQSATSTQSASETLTQSATSTQSDSETLTQSATSTMTQTTSETHTPDPGSQTFNINVTSSSSSNYTLSGSDRFGSVSGNDPSININVGDTINFIVNASGHPFYIRQYNQGPNVGSGKYSPSATNQGSSVGTVSWTPSQRPDSGMAVYQCGVHSSMMGTINIQS